MADGFDAYYQWLGIPPKDQPPSHYRLLGVDLFESNPDVIESAADRQMAHVRSFQSGPQGDASQKLLNEITAAKLCLLNATKKAEYDARLRAEKEAAEAAARPKARAVRGERPAARAEPLAPADTDLGPPMPRPPTMGPFGASENEPLTLTVGDSPPTDRLSLSGQSSAAKPLARRRTTTAQQAAIAGGVLGTLLVVVIAVVIARRGGSTTAENPKGKSDPQANASSSHQGKKTSGEELKTPFADPGTKGPPGTNGESFDADPLKGPPNGGPVLRLAGRDHVELADTSDVLPSRDYVWIDDAVPPGARLDGTWEWVTKPQPVFSGEKSIRRSGTGTSQQFFAGAEPRLTIGEGDRYFAYVYLDPQDPPKTIMLQWLNGDWHRAFWGEDKLEMRDFGEANTPRRWHMGPLPKTGEWVRLEVPVEKVGWKPGLQIHGWAFTQFDGTAYWDRAGIVTRTLQPGMSFSLLGDLPITAEALVRINPAKSPVYLMGNLAEGGVHPDMPPSTSQGWALLHGRQLRAGDAPESTGLFLQVAGKLHLCPASEMNDQWHHVAVCLEPGPTTAAYRVFLDGKQVLSVDVPAREQGKSPANVCLGSPRWLPKDVGTEGELSVYGFRLSSTARYATTFKPTVLKPDDKTLAALDFSDGQGDLLADASGKGHDGRIAGGHWIGPDGAVAPVTKAEDGVYLDDLKEVEFSVGHATLVKHGDRYGERMTFRGKHYPHSLGSHPPSNGASHVTYALNGEFTTFRATAALLEHEGWEMTKVPLTFKVIGDDKELWSKPIQRHGTSEDCSVSVAGVKTLRLEVDCPGFNGAASSFWLMPRLARRNASAESAGNLVYLDDLTETDFKVGPGTLGKHGDTGHKALGIPDGIVSFQGRKYIHAVCMHPGSGEVAYATYKLNGQFASFRASAGLLDLVAGEVRTAVTFKLIADGKELWTSQPIDRPGAGQACSVDLRGVKTLKIEVHSSGDHSGQYAAWLNPILSKTASGESTEKLVYLDDLTEVESKVGVGVLGKHGERGYTGTGVPDSKVVFRGRNYAHALSTHPAAGQVAYVAYKLDGKFASLRAMASIMDGVPGYPVRTAVTFKVTGDGKVLWTSEPIDRAGAGQPCSLDIKGVKMLRLEVHSSGDNAFQAAAWLEPMLIPRKIEHGTVPPDAELDKARQQVKEMLPADFADSSAALKLALARKFLSRAAGGEDAAAVRYALLLEVREIALQLVDLELAKQANTQLGETFDVDRAAHSLDVLNRLAAANVPAEKRKVLIDALVEATEEAVANDQLAGAADLAELTFKTAGKFREQLRRATALRDRVAQFRAWTTEADAAAKTLAEKPGDGAASTAVGLHLCFVRGDWEQGLPLLAKSDNAKLKSAAQLELAQPSAAEQQAVLGEAWWEVANAATGTPRLLYQQRSRHWYEQAIKGLGGAAKGAVEKRLVILEKALADISSAVRAKPKSSKPKLDDPAASARDRGKFLRFEGRDHVELQTTRGMLDLSGDFTVEIWARWDVQPEGEQYLAGDEAWETMSKEVPADKPCGWVIRAGPLEGDKRHVQFTVGTTIDGKNDWLSVTTAPMPTDAKEWQHIAVSKTKQSLKLFWNGKLSAETPCRGVPFYQAPTNLYLGVRKNGWVNRQFQGDIRAFRIANVSVYEKDFKPEETLAAGKPTLVLLDFATADGQSIRDTSGKRHSGRIVGAKAIVEGKP